MTRSLSYPAPCQLAVRSDTPARREDTDRGTLWTDAEITWMIRFYPTTPARICAEMLRRSEISIRIKAHRMGLRAAHRIDRRGRKSIVSRLTIVPSTPRQGVA